MQVGKRIMVDRITGEGYVCSLEGSTRDGLVYRIRPGLVQYLEGLCLMKLCPSKNLEKYVRNYQVQGLYSRIISRMISLLI